MEIFNQMKPDNLDVPDQLASSAQKRIKRADRFALVQDKNSMAIITCQRDEDFRLSELQCSCMYRDENTANAEAVSHDIYTNI